MTHPEPTTYINKLRHARVLIIGGSSSLGFGVAQALLEQKAVVGIASSSPDRVSDAVKKLQTTYPSSRDRVQGYTCNLGNFETLELEVARLFHEVEPGGPLDHVIFTAGDALTIRKVEDFTLAEMQQVGAVRFFAPLVVAPHLQKHLKPGPSSSYNITTGGLSQRPRNGWAVTMAYLTGLEGMRRALAKDLAPMRVNLVGPGLVDTELWTSHEESDDVAALKADLGRSMATGRMGRVEDVVEALSVRDEGSKYYWKYWVH